MDVLFYLVLIIIIAVLSYLLKQLKQTELESYESPTSGHISIQEGVTREKRLYLNLCLQGLSIDYKHLHKTYWYFIAHTILKHIQDKPESQILISGLGANTVSAIIASQNQQSHLTIIERDPLIIQTAQKYFELDKYQKQIKVIQSDWYTHLATLTQKYDVIVNDILTGEANNSVPECLTMPYLQTLASHLHPQGLIIMNFPRYATNDKMRQHFLSELKQHFPNHHIERIRFPYGFDNLEIVIKP